MFSSLLRAVVGGILAALATSLVLYLTSKADREAPMAQRHSADDLDDREAEMLLRELGSLT